MPFEPRTARSARNWCRDELCVHHTPSLSCCNAGEHRHVHSSPGDAQLPRLSWVCMWSLAQCPNMINMEHQQSYDWSGQTLSIIPGITVEHVCLESARRHSAIVMNCHREIGMFQAGSKMGRQDRTELVMFGMKACKFLRSTNITNVNLEFKFAQWVTLVFHVFPPMRPLTTGAYFLWCWKRDGQCWGSTGDRFTDGVTALVPWSHEYSGNV